MTEREPRGVAPAGLDRAGLVTAVREALAGVPYGARVLLACSGGPDSTALAHLVTEARPDLAAAVVHVRHGLRDDRADASAAAAHADAIGVAFHEREVVVRPGGEGPEAAARTARYAALRRVARSEGARWILLGHTADDRAETVVLNLARGTGIRGLAGMAPVRPEAGDLRIVRPLLRLRRADVRAFGEGEGLDAVADPTNRAPEQRRRRARDEVLPAMARLSGGPGDPVGVIVRLADLAADDADALDALAAAAARDLVVEWGPARAVRIQALADLPVALASRVVRLALAGVRGGTQGLSADAIGAVLALGPGEAADVGGGAWVTAGGGWLGIAPAAATPLRWRALPVPGAVRLEEVGVVLWVDRPWGGGTAADVPGQATLDLGDADVPVLEEAPPPPGPLARTPPREGTPKPAWTTLPARTAPAAVRARKPGDRITLEGGTRKLQDVLVDARVPRALRDLVPIVVDADDEPLWIPGIAAVRAGAGELVGTRLWLAPDNPAWLAPDNPAGYAPRT